MTKEDIPLAHAGMASEFELQKEYYEGGRIYILQIYSLHRNAGLHYCINVKMSATL